MLYFAKFKNNKKCFCSKRAVYAFGFLIKTKITRSIPGYGKVCDNGKFTCKRGCFCNIWGFKFDFVTMNNYLLLLT